MAALGIAAFIAALLFLGREWFDSGPSTAANSGAAQPEGSRSAPQAQSARPPIPTIDLRARDVIRPSALPPSTSVPGGATAVTGDASADSGNLGSSSPDVADSPSLHATLDSTIGGASVAADAKTRTSDDSALESWTDAAARVERATRAVLATMSGGDSTARHPETRIATIHAELRDFADLERFSGSIMATYYKIATPEQRRYFATRLGYVLTTVLIRALDRCAAESFQVVSPVTTSPNPERVAVQQELLTRNGSAYPIVYSMAPDRDGEWHARNVIVNGTNLGLDYRADFLEVAQDPEYAGDTSRIIDAFLERIGAADD